MNESYAKSLEQLREQFDTLPGRAEWPDPERPPIEILRFVGDAGQWLYCAIDQGAIAMPDWPGYMTVRPVWEYEAHAISPNYPESPAIGGTDHMSAYDAYWPACLSHMIANATVPVSSDVSGRFGQLGMLWENEWLPAIAQKEMPAHLLDLPICPPDLWQEMRRVTDQAFDYFADQLGISMPAQQSNAADQTPATASRRRRRRGPRPHRDANKDKRIYDARQTGRSYPDLARDFFGDEAKTREVGLAIDSHRHKLKRMGRK